MCEENCENETEVEVMEIALSEDEIDEWIVKLELLKTLKEPVVLEIDYENELQVNFYESVEDEE